MIEISREALVLDYDDMLYKTSEAFELTARLANRLGVYTNTAALAVARCEDESSDKTFDLDRFLVSQRVPDAEITGLYDALGENKEGVDLLHKDGRRLLTAIGETQAPAYILTRGTIPRQIAKLLSGQIEAGNPLDISTLLEFPHIITDKLVKSEVINDGWDPESGEYVAETTVGWNGLLVVRSYGGALLEDRPKGLKGLRYPNWTGILIRRPLEVGKQRRAAHQGEVPAGVMEVSSLDVVTAQLYEGKTVGDMVRRHLGEAVQPA